MTTPLKVPEIEEQLDEILSAVLSSRRSANGPARKLACLDRVSQEFSLHWASVIAKSNSEMAFQFVDHVKRAFELMESDSVTQWIIQAMDVYDREGLYPGSTALRNVDSFAELLAQKRYSINFADVFGILSKFAVGLSGRNFSIEEDNCAWTDTETIYLPEVVQDFNSEQENFQLYKVMAAYMLAQFRYGTFRVDKATGIPLICSEIANYRDQSKALQLFEAVENIRLLSCLERDLPGLANKLRALMEQTTDLPESVEFYNNLDQVKQPFSDVKTSLEVVRQLYSTRIKPPKSARYQGLFNLERVQIVTQQRIEREKQKFKMDLAVLTESLTDRENIDIAADECKVSKPQIQANSELDDNGEWEFSLTIDGEPVTPPELMRQIGKSIMTDFGEIPEEYLTNAGDGQYQKDADPDYEEYHIEKMDQDGLYYDEWDYRRGHFRKNWCVLKELDMHPGRSEVVNAILQKHAHLIQHIRRSFEALRGENRVLRRQKNGDDIDIDAVVDSYVDFVGGNEMSDRLFAKSRNLERDLAVVFMVDVSGSTKGWINEAERESLVLLSEALQTLGDRYAIYGFSGMTRKRCELYRIKTFEEPYDDLIRSRIAGMKPQDYTRMGVIIRHLTKKLQEIDAKTRVLITISDGKPDDYDGYRGEYGIEDTRKALIDAKYAGIHPFCITIDTHAHDYLPHMYGQVNYTVVSDVRKLPLKVSDIYRKLTT